MVWTWQSEDLCSLSSRPSPADVYIFPWQNTKIWKPWEGKRLKTHRSPPLKLKSNVSLPGLLILRPLTKDQQWRTQMEDYRTLLSSGDHWLHIHASLPDIPAGTTTLPTPPGLLHWTGNQTVKMRTCGIWSKLSTSKQILRHFSINWKKERQCWEITQMCANLQQLTNRVTAGEVLIMVLDKQLQSQES